MKKQIFIPLLGILFLLNSCVSTLDNAFRNELIAYLNKNNLIIATDPANPFQGTWIQTVPSGYISTSVHVINGMKGESHIYAKGLQISYWQKETNYTIEKKDNEYITSNNWRINLTSSENGDILNVENSTYERYVKK
jgi:hypothetical protein